MLTCTLSDGLQIILVTAYNVCVNGASSDTLPVSSGVPQGSILGPLLFIIYINDILTVPLSAGSMLLYADDSMLYHPISGPEDYHHLQENMNRLCILTNDNILKYNANKCKHMVISGKKQPLVPCTPLRVNQIAMEAVGSYKYLDVWLTSSLDWSGLYKTKTTNWHHI